MEADLEKPGNGEAARAGSGAAPPVFVSYSRRDAEFVERLSEALAAHGRDAWVDQRAIRPSADWMASVRAGIDSAEAFVFVLSPESLESEVCAEEIEHAVAVGKRIIPVCLDAPDGREVPAPIAARNWVDADDFDAAVAKLIEALDTDPEWAQEHTRLLVRALEWEDAARDASFLLRGSDLEGAEGWLTSADPRKDPQPTALQTEYVISSRQAATRTQRRRTVALTVVLIAALSLAAFALVQRNRADQEAQTSRARELAARSLLRAESDPEETLAIAVEAGEIEHTVEAEEALRRSLEGSDSIVAVLRGHSGPVTAVAATDDGRRVVSGGADGRALLWDVRDGTRLGELGQSPGPVADVAVSADGSRAVVARATGTIELFSLPAGRRIETIERPRPVAAIALDRDGRSIGIALPSGRAEVWDLVSQDPRLRAAFAEHRDRLFSITFSPDDRLVATASADGTARVWSARSGEERLLVDVQRVAKREQLDVNRASFSPGGQRLATASADGIARVWNLSHGRLAAEIEASSDELWAAELGSGGAWLLTAGFDGVGRVFDPLDSPSGDVKGVKPGLELSQLRGHQAAILDASLSRDGSRAITASSDGTVRIWDGRPDDSVMVFDRHVYAPKRVVFAPDGESVLSAGFDHKVRIWDPETGVQLQTFELCCTLYDARFDAGGTRIVTATQSYGVRVWELDPLRLVTALRSPPGRVQAAHLIADGSRVVTGSQDGRVRVWSAQDGRQLTAFPAGSATYSLAVSADERLVATGGRFGEIRLFELATGEEVARFEGHTDFVRELDFSPDGARLASASEDGTARIWSLADAADNPTMLEGHQSGVSGVAFSPDGARVVTGSIDRTVRVWDATSGRQLDILEGNRDWVYGVDWAPSGRTVASAGVDRTARLFKCELCVPFERLIEIARDRVAATLEPARLAQVVDD